MYPAKSRGSGRCRGGDHRRRSAVHRWTFHSAVAVGLQATDEEDDRPYRLYIQEYPNAPMAEQAERTRKVLAPQQVKYNSAGGTRPDEMTLIAEF
jgi:hypothetical protein